MSQVEIPDISDPDREKKIFAQIYIKLGQLLNYDYKAAEREPINWQLVIDSSGLRNSLLSRIENGQKQNLGICAGFACTLSNVAACLGINCKYISSASQAEEISNTSFIPMPKKNERGETVYKNGTTDPMGHAYNEVTLDGKRYYCDLTWDEKYIKSSSFPLPYFLKSYDEFYQSHKDEGFDSSIGDTEVVDSLSPRNQLEIFEDLGLLPEKIIAQLKVKELEELINQNYLCGFVQMLVDYASRGSGSLKPDMIQTVFDAIQRVEDGLLAVKSSQTNKAIRYDENHKTVFEISNPVTLKSIQEEILRKRKRKGVGRDE